MASTVVILLLGSVDSFPPKLFGRGFRTPLEHLLLPLATTVLHEELQDIYVPIRLCKDVLEYFLLVYYSCRCVFAQSIPKVCIL
jgi:hypothetical protein